MRLNVWREYLQTLFRPALSPQLSVLALTTVLCRTLAHALVASLQFSNTDASWRAGQLTLTSNLPFITELQWNAVLQITPAQFPGPFSLCFHLLLLNVLLQYIFLTIKWLLYFRLHSWAKAGVHETDVRCFRTVLCSCRGLTTVPAEPKTD